MSMCSISNWNLEVLVFEERGKLKNPEKSSWNKGEYQQQTLPTHDVWLSAGLKPGTHTAVGGRRVLLLMCHPLSPRTLCFRGVMFFPNI